MVRAFSKVYAFLNSNLSQITLMKPLEIKPLHKGMAETDISHEFRREPGLSSLVFGPERSHMLHMIGPHLKVLKSNHVCKRAT